MEKVASSHTRNTLRASPHRNPPAALRLRVPLACQEYLHSGLPLDFRWVTPESSLGHVTLCVFVNTVEFIYLFILPFSVAVSIYSTCLVPSFSGGAELPLFVKQWMRGSSSKSAQEHFCIFPSVRLVYFKSWHGSFERIVEHLKVLDGCMLEWFLLSNE